MKEYKDKYVYPAIFYYADDVISVEFPDLPGCLTYGDTEEEALLMAREVLGLWMESVERDNEDVPKASSLLDIKLEDNQRAILIDVWMPLVRKAIMNKAIKKILTIPQWLDIKAREEDINFSQVLQEGLKRELNIK